MKKACVPVDGPVNMPEIVPVIQSPDDDAQIRRLLHVKESDHRDAVGCH